MSPYSANEQFSQADEYRKLSEKAGAVDVSETRSDIEGKEIVIPKGGTLGEALLKAYSGKTKARSKMFSMLSQMAYAGFNVDLVHAGEKFVLSGNKFDVFDSKGTKKMEIDLESSERREAITESRRAIEDVPRDVAAKMAMDTYVLYTTAVAGADVKNWGKERDAFIDAIFYVTEGQTKFNDARAAIEKAEDEYGKDSGPYNRAIIDYLKAVQDLAEPQGEMPEFWEWVHAAMHMDEVPDAPGSYASPAKAEGEAPAEEASSAAAEAPEEEVAPEPEPESEPEEEPESEPEPEPEPETEEEPEEAPAEKEESEHSKKRRIRKWLRGIKKEPNDEMFGASLLQTPELAEADVVLKNYTVTSELNEEGKPTAQIELTATVNGTEVTNTSTIDPESTDELVGYTGPTLMMVAFDEAKSKMIEAAGEAAPEAEPEVAPEPEPEAEPEPEPEVTPEPEPAPEPEPEPEVADAEIIDEGEFRPPEEEGATPPEERMERTLLEPSNIKPFLKEQGIWSRFNRLATKYYPESDPNRWVVFVKYDDQKLERGTMVTSVKLSFVNESGEFEEFFGEVEDGDLKKQPKKAIDAALDKMKETKKKEKREARMTIPPEEPPPAGEATAENLATYDRLSSKMTKQIRSSKWDEVNDGYEQMEALPGVEIGYNEHYRGGMAAKQLGDMKSAQERFERAARIERTEEVTKELEKIQNGYGEVELVVGRGYTEEVTLEILEPPDDPEGQAALEYAQKALRESGSFSGLLPEGEYTFGGNIKLEVARGESAGRYELAAEEKSTMKKIIEVPERKLAQSEALIKEVEALIEQARAAAGSGRKADADELLSRAKAKRDEAERLHASADAEITDLESAYEEVQGAIDQALEEEEEKAKEEEPT